MVDLRMITEKIAETFGREGKMRDKTYDKLRALRILRRLKLQVKSRGIVHYHR